jgi:ribosomal protein L37AE/L43A
VTPSTTNTAAREVVQALRDLLRHVEVNTCTHEETHRGGAIWTICDSCDRKWADDRGGFVPHEDAPEVVAARAALESFTLTQQQGGEQDAKDAERYRWLRKQGNREKAADMTLHRMDLDAAIDAEMAGANARHKPTREAGSA